MKQANDFRRDMLDFDLPEAKDDRIWHAYPPTEARVDGGDIVLTVPFGESQPQWVKEAPKTVDHEVRIRAYAGGVLRMTATFAGEPLGDDSPMLQYHASLMPEALSVENTEAGYRIIDAAGAQRAVIRTTPPEIKAWSDLVPPPPPSLDIVFYPDGKTAVPLMAFDRFFPDQIESFPLAYVERDGRPHRALLAFHASPNEHYAGAGERFGRLDHAGSTFTLENTDAMGVNNRRVYKNIPFYLSSRPYGAFLHTSHHIRLSLADISRRAAQVLVEEPAVDLFVLGGGSLERVLYNYRRVTGFPADVPVWSYGTWMSRMTYFAADEVNEIARKLRDGRFPCDVLHLDTGWFAQDWVCEYEFSKERFPDPAGFMADLRKQGYRVTLWQNPAIGPGNKLLDEAKANRYLAPMKGVTASASSDFSQMEVAGQIDFSNPAAVEWYKGLLKRLLEMGAVAIKTDFGENITFEADFMMAPERLHNLYALLYQRAAYEITDEVTGEPIIWARSGWAGCQRYPLHWGGDCACTWDGLAGSLRGGLHFGLSGFAFWSHDVPGFHGVPDFMNNWPSDNLYVRWTQFGVFTSHLRYHGTSPREPYEYPAIADTVRMWLNLRYGLIPYLVDQGRRAVETGMPVLRALVLHHEDDPMCWHIDDQFCCGEDVLVCPVMNDAGVRDVYLPAGEWVDFWTGEALRGGRWLKDVVSPLDRIPVYLRQGSRIRVYPEPVQCTDEMDLAKAVELVADGGYMGVADSPLAWCLG